MKLIDKLLSTTCKKNLKKQAIDYEKKLLIWASEHLHEKIKNLNPVTQDIAHNKKIALLKRKIFTLENDNALLDSENEELKNKMEALKTDYEDLSNKHETLKRKEKFNFINIKKAEKSKYQREIEDLRIWIHERDAKIQALNLTIKTLTNEETK